MAEQTVKEWKQQLVEWRARHGSPVEVSEQEDYPPTLHPHLRLMELLQRAQQADTRTAVGRANLATIAFKIRHLCHQLNSEEPPCDAS